MSQLQDLPLSSLPPSGGAGSRYAFVAASWHADIVGQARDGFLAELAALGVPSDRVDLFEVPGAFEIPLHAQRLARSGRYAAIAGGALVVDGGIYRHEFVAETVVRALMDVQLQTGVPVLSVVLTPHHFHEHEEHRNYFRRHFVQKGAEAARAAVQTVRSLQQVDAALAAAG